MSNKRLKIENLENLQELNAEEFSSIQGGYYNANTEDIEIEIDLDFDTDFDISQLSATIEDNSEAGDIALTITGGIVEGNAHFPRKGQTIVLAGIPVGFRCHGSLTGGPVYCSEHGSSYRLYV